jgi:UDP-N-acetylglucosamine 2-epimerase (non-hydrolysing)
MTFYLIAGARPNFMKVAPILRQFRERQLRQPGIDVRLVHTGQHYDKKMSDDFFEELEMPMPDINLAVGSGTHAQQTARIMIAFEEVCVRERPDWVIVVGDVNSTIACALTAKKLGIRVAHVEAGLRSGDMSMPEEINRLCTDAIADMLFTTDEFANENLRREGITAGRIQFVGNTMIDSLLQHIKKARTKPLPQDLAAGEFAVLTLHRPGNVDDRERLQNILDSIIQLSNRIPVVFPVHPRTTARLTEFGLLERLHRERGMRLMEPMTYLTFLGLVAHSRMVLTDSGGIQEETTVLGVPCITMRPNTERPITCEVGTNVLAGDDPARILSAASAVLEGRIRRSSIPEKWDGQAARRIVDLLMPPFASADKGRTDALITASV